LDSSRASFSASSSSGKGRKRKKKKRDKISKTDIAFGTAGADQVGDQEATKSHSRIMEK